MFEIDKYPEIISFFQQMIQKQETNQRTPEKIREIIQNGKALFALANAEYSEDAVEKLARYFEQQFEVQQSFGSAIVSETHKPWLVQKKAEIDFYFWDRFRRYLEQDVRLPPQVVMTLDQDTDSILDYAGDPSAQKFQRRGMVVGHVQSGKTSSYSSLICKAADAGYKVIILLTGITNSLRRQTQDRIDHAFIGRRAEFGKGIKSEKIGAALYASDGNDKWPFFGTTLAQDFSLKSANSFGVPIQSLGQPVIFTTKKNPSTLANLLEWLKLYYPNGGIDHPLLLIDDEADNASINTKKQKGEVTRINEGIRAILDQFNKASYVAYTATPFANIFISPDSSDEMSSQDLFPSDFIKVLEAPDNYVGPSRIFAHGGDLSALMVREPDDYEDILPVKHKNHTEIDELPRSLEEAVIVFILVRCIRIINGDGHKHCTMMVNVSRFNSVQDSVSGEIHQYLTRLSDDVKMHSHSISGERNSLFLKQIYDLFEREFIDTDCDEAIPDWPSVKATLVKAVSTISIQIVNMKGGGIEYDKHEETGLHVIAVGGLALSRGLTLEGLCVSYILRNPSAYDTLMQMGRWFGYRPRYEHLCRLYIPDFARDYYEYITYATDELRSEIKLMESEGKTPKEFGLKVREHPAAIRITAANKMSAAVPISLSISFEKKHVEGHAIFTSETINSKNLDLVKDFLAELGPVSENQSHYRPRLFWDHVDKSTVRVLLSKFHFPDICKELSVRNGGTSLVLDYMDDRPDELLDWDVCVPESKSGEEDFNSLETHTLKLRKRMSGKFEQSGRIYRITGKSNRVADRRDSSFGLNKSINEKDLKADWECNSKRTRPILIIHYFQATMLGEKETFVSLSVCFPGTSTYSPERKYMANEVWSQLNLFDEPDFDETDEDLESYDA